MKYKDWSNLAQLVLLTMLLVGVLIFVSVYYDYESLDEKTVKMSVAVLVGTLAMLCYVLLGAYCAATIMKLGRKKSGLRPEWTNKGFDELEERVRKLEEKKDPEK